jgi:hypothetical protein
LSLAIGQILLNQSESQKAFLQASLRLQDALESDQELEAVDWLTDELGMA